MEGFSEATPNAIGSVLKNWFFTNAIYEAEIVDGNAPNWEALGITPPNSERDYYTQPIRVNLNNVSIYYPASEDTTYLVIGDAEYEIVVSCEAFDGFMVQWLSGAYETN